MHLDTEVLIVGGGIGGLWLLDDLRRAGYDALLVENRALGTGQTIAAQGILHGGLKHAFVGRDAGLVGALRDMPPLWRECLEGKREPNLSEVKLRSTHCVCWRTGSVASTLAQFGATLGLQTPMKKIADEDRPDPLVGVPGTVYRLDEQVVDPHSLLTVLARRNSQAIIQASVRAKSGAVELLCRDNRLMTVRPKRLVLTAGASNGELMERLMQGRYHPRHDPLPILVLRGDLPTLNGFCLDGTKAKVIITTQRIAEQDVVWQVASETVSQTALGGFADAAMRELKAALPEFTLPKHDSQVSVAVRAEGFSNRRSDDVCVEVYNEAIVAWPTKLVLAPRMSASVMARLTPPQGGESWSHFQDWPEPPVAAFPWL